jgi:hypothetical protein
MHRPMILSKISKDNTILVNPMKIHGSFEADYLNQLTEKNKKQTQEKVFC